MAQASCRIGYDMGSSGIRASMSGSTSQARVEIDYLAPLLAGRGLEETVPATVTALEQLPVQAGFPGGCARVGAGFSAWRLALENNRAALVDQLRRIHAQSDVAVLVMPQNAEGRYGFLSAQQRLGGALSSSHVLDIGGGSLQVAGQRHTFGDALGQKTWRHLLCSEAGIGSSSGSGSGSGSAGTLPCVLQPMDRERLAGARRLIAMRLKDIRSALPEPVSMTAISRPVTQGVAPAVAALNGEKPGKPLLRLADLSLAIDRMALLTLPQAAARLKLDEKYAGYLLSDMLLTEGILRATGNSYLRVAQADLNNAPGILADETAYGWTRNYPCYLQRLQQEGLAAYGSDQASCEPSP